MSLAICGPNLKADFSAAAATETDVAECIRATQQKQGYVLDPHTACGVVAMQRLKPDGITVTLATAHPAKFPDAIEGITGTRPALPGRLANLMTDPERFDVLPANLKAIQTYVESVASARGKA